jgi:hypothetical protein
VRRKEMRRKKNSGEQSNLVPEFNNIYVSSSLFHPSPGNHLSETFPQVLFLNLEQ